MKNTFKIVCVAIMVIGAIVGYFSDIPMVDYISWAVEFTAAGALFGTLRNKSVKKDWKFYVTMICLAISAFGLGFLGVTADSVAKLITGIATAIALIVTMALGLKLTEK